MLAQHGEPSTRGDEALSTLAERQGPWVLARELAGSSDWYEQLWQRRERLAERPALVLWGMKDPAFGRESLELWEAALPNVRIVEFPEAGHFVQEEAPEESAQEIRTFLSGLH